MAYCRIYLETVEISLIEWRAYFLALRANRLVESHHSIIIIIIIIIIIDGPETSLVVCLEISGKR